MGGENLNVAMDANPILGSPPHGRGKGKDDRRNQQCGGITPAWAGKRTSFPKRLCRRWDHPRVGGEKLMSATALWYAVGSPPRRRGKAGKNGGCDFGDRITPAWAGKRARCPCWCAGGQDHPRVGGEKLVQILGSSSGQGSPPRGRGKGKQINKRKDVKRITPAWAGKS